MQTIFIEKIVDFHPVKNNFKVLIPHLGLMFFEKVFDCVENINALDVSEEEKLEILKIKEHISLLRELKTKIEQINDNYFLSDGFAFFYIPKNSINTIQNEYYIRNRIWLDESEYLLFNEENKQLISEIDEIKKQIKNTIPFYSSWEHLKIDTRSFEVENLNFSEDKSIVEFCGNV